jgi:hypothetical protein
MPTRPVSVHQSSERAAGNAPGGSARGKSCGTGVLDGGKNPYQGITLGVARRFEGAPLPLFALGETDVFENTFREGGLRNVTIRALSFSRHFSSTAEMIRRLKETAFLRGPIEKLGEAQREQAWAEIERQLSRLEGPNGIEVPGEFLIGVGNK